MLFNKKTLFSFAALLSNLTNIQAQEAAAPADSAVIKLTKDTFADFIQENPLFLAEFFAPWCGHCKHLAPEYVKAAAELEDKNIPLVQIDCTEEQELCMEYEIPGYPSLKVFKNNDPKNTKDYQGARSAESIVSYMIKESLPAVQQVGTDSELQDIVQNATQPVIVDSGVKGLNATFYDVAAKLSSDYTFISYVTSNKTVAKDLSLYLPSEDTPIVFNGDLNKLAKNATQLQEWLKVEALPYFGEIDGSVFQTYVESDIPLAYFFYTSDEEKSKYTEFFTELGKKYRGSLNFVGLDSRKYGRHAENLNMKEQFPLFAIHDMKKNLKYGLPQLAEEKFDQLKDTISIETKDISRLVENFVKGKANAIVKSEPEPEVQESNVFKLVGTTHDKIVSDKKKDVLVKYYAPWCGHCKRLAPIYEELADVYASDKKASSKVLIAEVDATANDISDLNIEGYPTIILYPAGKNAEPVTFTSQRTLDGFLKFLKENGSNRVDGESLYEKYAAAKKEAEEDEEDEEDLDHDEL
ncbi:protein disulfide isomerase PDI1 NDAI_0A00310 [Naumovozyma dairenensis CBS 421]|uniref:Protein disulfide-isomerase n=1 Tax=Naumovozyma dairenensis (strain ATCC 10597 / BCRC 20456 / CBS 421 / NBRC 0211 / NRRL Y-12639) TaxID=1071378 RepID=G0W5H7_NAUDC|nr:hypothetical protein NDAI_0A00310 [Naumovozyma dairenensis CBS 421]CCD22191.1 hypothetical protein NDAI_0A00310 [Naumovozyma dairenensis CBS 421]